MIKFLIENNMTRNALLDIVKAFAIITVVIGHCIQYGSGLTYFSERLFYENNIFKIIYSFHMPLFMIVSGYLFAFSIKKDWRVNVKRKIKSLVLPVFIWSIVLFLYQALIGGNLAPLISTCCKFFVSFITNLWFLWAVFWCSCVVLFVYKVFDNRLIVYALIFFVLFFVPDGYNLKLYKFMYPYFIFGFLYNLYGISSKIEYIYKKWIVLLTLGCIYWGLLSLHSTDSFIYTSGHCINGRLISQFCIDIYRYVLGFVGCAFFILLFYKLQNRLKAITPALMYIGKRTMGIYVISDIFNNYILTSVTHRLSGCYFIVIVIETILILFFSILSVNLISMSKLSSRLLLGQK